MLVSAANATEVERLTKENAVLRQEVEQLKQELSAAEVQHGGLYMHHLHTNHLTFSRRTRVRCLPIVSDTRSFEARSL